MAKLMFGEKLDKSNRFLRVAHPVFTSTITPDGNSLSGLTLGSPTPLTIQVDSKPHPGDSKPHPGGDEGNPHIPSYIIIH